MTPESALLVASIEDNIAWCSTVCASHHSEERNSDGTWANFVPSPPFYPNIITRRRDCQAEVARLVKDIRQNGIIGAWGIKDSFHDLDLTPMGFIPVIEGEWFGGEPAMGGQQHDWEVARRSKELSLWEQAWSDDGSQHIFKDALLADPRIRFWMLRQREDITAGCISFVSRSVIGLSNWFCRGAETIFDLGIMPAIAETAAGRPVVCWASETDAAPAGLGPLGPLRVWISSP